MKHLSRRRFLTVMGLGTGVSAAGAVLAQRWGIGHLASLKSRISAALVNPGLKDAPKGVLNEATVRALLATTEGLVGTKVETSHYETFFRWRSENLSGYRGLYEQFAAAVDRAAKEAQKADFASCDMETRREILQGIDPNRSGNRIYALVLERGGFRFEKYIFQQILALFSQTDGWILLGYKAWPGTPRGLDSYTKAPPQSVMGKISLLPQRG